MGQYHQSVLLNELIDGVSEGQSDFRTGPWLDLTFGGGGHTLELLKRFPSDKVIAFDRDADAIERAKSLPEFDQDRLELVHENFTKAQEILTKKNVKSLSGIIADFGVSSHQLDEAKRGLSFRQEGPLDMRMDQRDSLTAHEVVNSWDFDQLLYIFQSYGEERFAKRIAQKIIEERKNQEITTTKELENIIFHCYPSGLRHQKTHPATRVFQAIRIAVNRELESIEKTLPYLCGLLSPGARIAVISFHSLEDRLIKLMFKELSKDGFRILTKKPLIASEEEVKINRRSRSAKLRLLEREVK